ncbi:MAG: hypothetical protein L0G99_01950, partial [Propionibacteriales bacterium]|nr:hypothetical protein [Propionibacteriales bacterium]
VGQLAVAAVWAGLWGVTDGMASVVQQHRLVAIAPASAPVLFGLNSSAIYVGVAMGGLVGGLAQSLWGAALIGVPAAVLALSACLITIIGGRAGRTTAGAS